MGNLNTLLKRAWKRTVRHQEEQHEEQRKLETGLYQKVYNLETGETEVQRIPKRERPLCGARTRQGEPCKARAVFGKSRCRMHGGLSTGPRTETGRLAIVESNRRRAEERRTTRGV